jgi:hypothetical protein
MKRSGFAIAMAFAVSACTAKEPKSIDTADLSVSAPQRGGAQATPSVTPPSVTPVSIKVYKTATCGCCKAWVEHLEQNGFKVEVMDMPDLSAVKAKYGIKPEMQACHTAVVGNYVVEGHVPADLILKMINEKPAIAGIAVPGMPMGSPGMESGTKESYTVLSFDSAGKSSVYANR